MMFLMVDGWAVVYFSRNMVFMTGASVAVNAKRNWW